MEAAPKLTRRPGSLMMRATDSMYRFAMNTCRVPGPTGSQDFGGLARVWMMTWVVWRVLV